MIKEDENSKSLIERKAQIINNENYSERPETHNMRQNLLKDILVYNGTFFSMPSTLKQVCVQGSQIDMSILKINGFYDNWIKKHFTENNIDIMLFAEQIMENIGSTAFSNDSIELLKKINVITLVNVDPNLTFSFINQLLKNNIININEFICANMIKILATKASDIDPTNIISIIGLYFNQVTQYEYCNTSTYEEDIETALKLVWDFIHDTKYMDAAFTAISGSLNALNAYSTLSILRENIPKIVSLFLSSRTTNYASIMNFIIQICIHSSTLSRDIMRYRNELIGQIVKKEYRESVIMFITNLWSFLLCYDDGIDSFLNCLRIFIDDLEVLNMEECILFINYFEFIVETIEENVFDYIFSGEIDVMSILTKLIEISENLNDKYICKTVHIITFMLPELLTKSVYEEEIPFEEIMELIDICIISENEYLHERAFLLKEVVKGFI